MSRAWVTTLGNTIQLNFDAEFLPSCFRTESLINKVERVSYIEKVRNGGK